MLDIILNMLWFFTSKYESKSPF